MAMKAAREVLNSEGNGFGEKLKGEGRDEPLPAGHAGRHENVPASGRLHQNGQMEKLGQMLNDGQRRRRRSW